MVDRVARSPDRRYRRDGKLCYYRRLEYDFLAFYICFLLFYIFLSPYPGMFLFSVLLRPCSTLTLLLSDTE